jgi:DNA-binding FadR family transcriptional regulator
MSEMRGHARKALAALRQFVESQVTDGHWPPGTQLPTERELAEQFAISRNTVRRQMLQLVSEGWIDRHVGRGTFACAPPNRIDTAETDASTVNPEEVMEARLLIEPLLAKLVVIRASNAELLAMEEMLAAGAQSETMAEFEFWDNKLHRAIAEASKNQYLIKIVDGIHKARQSPAWFGLRRRGLTDERRQIYQEDHEKIVQALLRRDGEQAREAILSHLSRVRTNLMIT